jgi:ferredoxin
MPTIISTDLPLCIGCYKCVRICPVETANVTYLDGRSHLKVRIDQTRCVRCGACLDVCPRGARHYQDDTDLMFRRLEAGDEISVIMSPTIKGNMKDYRKYIYRLKALGVKNVFSLSLGQEIYTWATMKLLETKKPQTIIASYCPVLVSFCENHRPELIPKLSPIINPASILSAVLYSKVGLHDDLATISPCLAESSELDRPEGRLRYSLSFSRLREHMIRAFQDDQGDQEAEFDEIPFGAGSSSDFGGTFTENMEFYLGPGFRSDRFFGTTSLNILDEYKNSEPADLPQVLDVIVCDGGCHMGPGRILELKRMGVNAHRHAERSLLQKERDRAASEERMRFFDETLDLSDFERSYRPSAIIQDYLPEDRVNDAFLSLNKSTMAQKTIDCYACGAHSCRQMARMVALGVNLPTNCVALAKELIAQAGKKMSDYLQLVRLIGEYMLASGLNDIGPTIEHSLMALCSALDISRASIWQSDLSDPSGLPGCSILLSFPAKLQFKERSFNSEQLPGWVEALSEGEIIVKSFAELNQREKIFFSDRDLGVLAMVPIMAQGEFWGLILITRRHDHPFTREEISVVESAAFLIISTLISSINLGLSDLQGGPGSELGLEPLP